MADNGLFPGFLDPQTQGLLSAGAGLMQAGGPQRFPVSLGQAMGQGLQSGMQGYRGAVQDQNTQQMTQLQIQSLLYELNRKKMQEEALRGLIPQDANAPAAAAMAGPQISQGPSAQSAQAVGAPWAANLPPQPQTAPQLPSGAPLQRPQTIPLQALQRYAISGGNPEPFLKINEAARGRTENVNVGNETLVRDKDTGAIIQRIPHGAAPATIPYEAQNIGPTEYRDFLLNKGRVSAAQNVQNVQNFTPASEEAQKEFMKSTRTNYEALRNAPTVLKNISDAKALIPSAKVFMGPGGETLLETAKFLNNRLGMSIETKGINSAEELRTRTFYQIMENLKKMDAQPSQMQQVMMRDALGKLGTDPNALGAVLDSYGDIIRGKVVVHNKEIQGATARGVKFPYDPLINLDAPTSTSGTGVRRYNPATGRIE